MGLNSESRTINASRNIFSALMNKIIVLALTFISRKFFIEYIGVAYLGINGLFANILTLLSMADLGLGTAINVSLYKPIAEGDTKKISALLSYYCRLYRYIAAGVTVIGLALMPFLKYLVNMETDIPYLYVYYVIFVLKNTVSYLFVYKSSLIRADQKNYIINKVDIYVNIIKVVVQLLSVILVQSYLFYIICEIIAVAMHNVLVSIIAERQYPFIKDNIELKQEERKEIFSNISSVFLYKIAWSLLNGTDNILMSIIVGTVYVGLYSNYYTITSNLENLIALLFTSLTASVGNLIATSSAENRYKTFKSMQMISSWLCSFVCICLFFLTQDFIELWLGKALLLDNLTLIAIIFNVFFSFCMRPVWTFREGTGMYKQIRYIMFATALLNLILSIAMGKWLGVSGILFATSISKLMTYFWYEPNILFKNFFWMRPYHYYMELLQNVGLLLLCGVLCYIPIRVIHKVSVLTWLLKAFICLFIINVIYFIRYMKTEEFADLSNKIVLIMKRTDG